jgi:hypothetical protein
MPCAVTYITVKRHVEAALIQTYRKRRNLPFSVPNLNLVSVSILFGGVNCGSIVCAIHDHAIDEMAILVKKVHAVLGHEMSSTGTFRSGILCPSVMERQLDRKAAGAKNTPLRGCAGIELGWGVRGAGSMPTSRNNACSLGSLM